ncbi:MAG: EAL domain-containing protein [Candidatus Nanopelagicales bacterium]|nr:EAL domain-containing protein [Candidatus Nanopelagicales bacterium]
MKDGPTRIRRAILPRSRRDMWWIVAFVGAVSAAHMVGDWLPGSPGVPALSLAAGVGVGMLVRAPQRAAVAMGVVQLVGLPLASVVSGGSGAEIVFVVAESAAIVTVAVVLRWTGARRMVSVGYLVAYVAIAVSITFGWYVTATLIASGLDAWRLPDDTWLGMWWSTAFGVIMVGPGLLARRPRYPAGKRGAFEVVVVICVGLGVFAVVFLARWELIAFAWSSQYLLIPVLLWIAWRFGLAVVAGTIVLLEIGAEIATAAGLGPFSIADPVEASVLLAQMSAVVVSIALYAVAINEERRSAAESRLRATSGMVESLLANSDARIAVRRYSPDAGPGVYILANPRFAESLDLSVEEVIGRSDEELLGPVDARRSEAEDRAVLGSACPRVFMTRWPDRSAPGGLADRILLVTKFPLADAQGHYRSVGSIGLDITEHRRRDQMMRLTFDQSPIPMARLAWRKGRAAEVLDANRSLAELLDTPVKDLMGSRLERFLHPDERGVAMISTDRDGRAVRRRELRLVVPRGEDTWVTASGSVVEPDLGEAFALLTLEDVTARRIAEHTLTHQARHDALTGLLNRYALLDRLEGALGRLWRDPTYVGVLFCDLDGFKHLNDTLGHRAGDQMLIIVADRLRAVTAPEDTVARLGGDEFVLICEGLSSPGGASVVGERIRAAMRAPFGIDGREYGVTVSIGIASTMDPQTKAEDLLRRADLAMYRAKDAGRNRVEFYAEELEARAVAHVETTEVLRRAISEDRVRVHYQPIIDLTRSGVVGIEALARIINDDGQIVSPDEFIGVAEQSGLVVPLGERVIDLALDELKSWRAAGLDINLSVNVSPRQLSNVAFAPSVFERLIDRGLPPGCLTVEVTEGAIVDATGPTLLTLRRLRSYGVQVGIDDFGTGYSSLTTLKYLPADVLKIDRSFVEGLGHDPKDAAIVSALIRISHELGLEVVGEGVETEAQELALRQLGCDFVQGYLYGRPAPASELDLSRTGHVGKI